MYIIVKSQFVSQVQTSLHDMETRNNGWPFWHPLSVSTNFAISAASLSLTIGPIFFQISVFSPLIQI